MMFGPPPVLGPLVQSDYDVGEVCNKLRRARPDDRVCYDIETGAPDHLHELFKQPELLPFVGSYITGLSVCVNNGYKKELEGFYIPIGHEKGNISEHARENVIEALGSTAGMHVLHNSPFDWQFLLNEGILMDVPVHAVDTQVLRWLQDENGIKGLKELGEMWLGEDASSEKRALGALLAAPYSKITDARNAVLEAFPELGFYKIKGQQVPYDGREGKKLHPGPQAERWAQRLTDKRHWGSITPEEMAPYGARDATLTAELEKLLVGTSPLQTVEREMKVNAICVDMTRKGVSVDVEQLKRTAILYEARAQELGAYLRDVHALENPNSGPQVAELLYDRLGLPVRGRTPTGAPATDKNALEQLAGDPVAAKILEYRKWDHARTAYAVPFVRFSELSTDGRVHGMYGTARTVTGRLSASAPNVMTIPREDSLPELRQAFCLDPAQGVERLGFDLKSAELWVTASVTGDPVLTAALLEDRNLHAEMMVQVFGGERDKSRREYTLSKNVNYGIEYGAGLDQITIFAAKAGYDPHEARRVAQIARDGHKRLFAKQHRVAAWWADQADERGKIPLYPLGRYRHFRSPGRRVPGYTALNAIVQGGVAEFMKDTMIELYARGYGEYLILQVHDELVFDCPTKDNMRQPLLELLNKIAVDINPFKYPLQWEAKSWAR